MKRKSPPDPPFLWLVPSFLQWHTLGDCTSLSASHTTFSTQHCQPSNSICLCFFACSFHLHEGNESWPPEHEESFLPPCMWCFINLLYLHLKLDMLFSLQLNLSSKNMIFLEFDSEKHQVLWCFPQNSVHFEICCQHTTDWSARHKQLLLPLTLNEGDVISVNHRLEQLHLTGSPSGKLTPPSHLSINKPLPSLSPSLRFREHCTSVTKSSFHSLEQQDAMEPVSPRKRREMFYVRGKWSAITLSQ